MGEKELKHVIALLLEDARRLQGLKPNAGTMARIGIAEAFLRDEIDCHSTEEDATVALPLNVVLAFMTEDNPVRLRFIRMSAIKRLSIEKERA